MLTLASFDVPCQIRDIKERALDAGFRIPEKWNMSSILCRSGGLAIRTPGGWEITDGGKQHIRDLGITEIGPAAVQVATDLRLHLSTIRDDNTRSFIEEAIECYEAGFYRSAIIMSWVGAVAILHSHVHALHLQAFNAAAKCANPKWKEAKKVEDLGRMREAEFLERIGTITVIGRNTKKELERCLDLRNSCGHPNSLQVSINAAAHHIETLLLNVFKKFQ